MLGVFLLAIGLAADAFAVAIAAGVAARGKSPPALRLAIAFGLAQGLMPLLGYGASLVGGSQFTRIDHWVAFALLMFLGGRMMWAGIYGSEEEASLDTSRFIGLLVAALATSIDAAAAGLSLPALGTPVIVSCIVIAAITGLLSGLGAQFGARLGLAFGARAEVAGGLVLIFIGCRILIQHLSA